MGQIFPGGNEGAIKDGMKEQALGTCRKLYELINLEGGGKFVEYIKRAKRNKDFQWLERQIRHDLAPYVYNEGRGQWFRIKDLTRIRAGLVAPGDIQGCDLTPEEEPEIGEIDSAYKRVCWRLEERGGVGESALHNCLLNASSLHEELVRRLLRLYPALINDVYTSDEFYGENVLHMAIVNEDPDLVCYLLDRGADFHQRACGNFFTPDDQKAHRRHRDHRERFDLPIETNYAGHTSWGEFPLSFAVCLGQIECVRILLSRGARPNNVDSNGCTALHLIVIHFDMMQERAQSDEAVYTKPQVLFDLLVENGADFEITNRQGLTPLTLAAKIACKPMFEHLLEQGRQIMWMFGSVTCAVYPLDTIDTISAEGHSNTNSALYHVTYGRDARHLEMFNDIIWQLLNEKWKAYARKRFYVRFVLFALYFLTFMLATSISSARQYSHEITSMNETCLRLLPCSVPPCPKNDSCEILTVIIDPCFLKKSGPGWPRVRSVLEVFVILGAFMYLCSSLRDLYSQGVNIFFKTLSGTPSLISLLISISCVFLAIPFRAACLSSWEDVIVTIAILCCAPYFLFFARGFRLVGPSVVMIYRMMSADLLRFFSIYIVFAIGFSQSYYILFRKWPDSVFYTSTSALLRMFLASMNYFTVMHDSFKVLKGAELVLAKILFLVYMIVVALLLMNMLIAMMANTYETVRETQLEWLRQWAKIIMVMEFTLSPGQRRRILEDYSLPMADERRALLIRYHQSEEEKEKIRLAKLELTENERNRLQMQWDAASIRTPTPSTIHGVN